MNSRYYIVLAFLLFASCWSGKVSTSRKLDIEQHEIEMNRWSYKSDSSWRLAINDSLAWRRKTTIRQYGENMQLAIETITEESMEQMHEENQETDDDVEANGEDKRDVEIEYEEKDAIKVKGVNSYLLVLLLVLGLFVCVIVKRKW